jgi:hypothetical protein
MPHLTYTFIFCFFLVLALFRHSHWRIAPGGALVGGNPQHISSYLNDTVVAAAFVLLQFSTSFLVPAWKEGFLCSVLQNVMRLQRLSLGNLEPRQSRMTDGSAWKA